MDIELIIHGKPISGSHKATSGIAPSFCDNLVKGFFESMDRMSGKDALIVDARQWENVWYGVYTFWDGANVKGTDGRNSFFAITVVLPERYFYVVSEVYTFLKRVCKEYVVERYISKNGKYLVQDLSNEKAFAGLVEKVKEITDTNLLERFDDGFKLQPRPFNDVYYNVLDCDARSFVQELRKCGRILVTETAETKDAKLSTISKKEAEIAKCKKEIEDKNKKIEELNEQNRGLEAANSSTSKSRRKLQDSYDQLKKEKEQADGNYVALQEHCNTLENKLDKIAEIVGERPTFRPEEQNKKQKKEGGWLSLLLPFNTFLLVVILLLFGFCYGKGIDNGPDTPTTGEDNTECSTNEEVVVHAQVEEVDDGEQDGAGDAEEGEKSGMDEDCHLSVIQDRVIQMTDGYYKVDTSKPLLIILSKKPAGYAVYTSNIKNQSDVKDSIEHEKSFTIQVNNSKNEVVISYRSNDRNKTNPNNKIIIKP